MAPGYATTAFDGPSRRPTDIRMNEVLESGEVFFYRPRVGVTDVRDL
jgi:hypothetical protein